MLNGSEELLTRSSGRARTCGCALTAGVAMVASAADDGGTRNARDQASRRKRHITRLCRAGHGDGGRLRPRIGRGSAHVGESDGADWRLVPRDCVQPALPSPESVDDDGPPYAAALHAADLEAFIDRLHAGPVHLVASSYGGAVALLAARDRPELVRSMVLTEPALLSLLPASAPERAGLAGLATARERLAKGDTDGAIASFVDTIIGPGASLLVPQSTRVMINDNLAALRREAAAPDPDPVFSCRGRRSRPRARAPFDRRIQSPVLPRHRARAGCLPSRGRARERAWCRTRRARTAARAIQRADAQFLQKH